MKNKIAKMIGYRRKTILIFEQKINPIAYNFNSQGEVKFRIITKEDVLKFNKFSTPNKVPEILKRLFNDKLGFGAFYGNELIAFTWISLSDEYEKYTQETIRVKSGEAYSFDGETLKGYKKKGIYYELLRFRDNYLNDIGIKKLISWIYISNIAARLTNEKIGATPIKILFAVDIIGFKFRFYKKIQNKKKYLLKR